jgi:hypothetical protein
MVREAYTMKEQPVRGRTVLYDTYGKFPATTPSIFAFMYMQAHHLDLGFYDHYFKPGSYPPTHAEHMNNWH